MIGLSFKALLRGSPSEGGLAPTVVTRLVCLIKLLSGQFAGHCKVLMLLNADHNIYIFHNSNHQRN